MSEAKESCIADIINRRRPKGAAWSLKKPPWKRFDPPRMELPVFALPPLAPGRSLIRRTTLPALALCALPLCPLAAVAADAPKGAVHASNTPPVPEEPNATVAGVVVHATHVIPRVESTFPAQNAKVTPGLLILRATFSTQMRPDGWSYVPSAKGTYPDCAETPRLLDDKRTFVLICRTLPGKAYSVWFNQPPVADFSSSGGRPAIPYELTFTTADEEPIRTLADAMKADKALTSASNPVEPLGSAPLGQPRVPPE
jgi:hypothetical protein